MSRFKHTSKTISTAKLTKCVNSWDDAISDAETKIDRLKTAILVFEKNKAAGEPWPTEGAKG